MLVVSGVDVGSHIMANVILEVDGASYTIVLPHAEIDYIQKKIATEKIPYEHVMLRDMASRLNQNSLVLDIGANVGNHTLYLASTTGCKVEAFEPNMELCEALNTSIEINGLRDNVTLHPVGVSDTRGSANFKELIPENLGAQSLKIEIGCSGNIPLIRLDDLQWNSPVHLIKIDVEGMEYRVLQGASELIKKYSPILYIEGLEESSFWKILSWLKKINYQYCKTFNATPTHLFRHVSDPPTAIEIENYLQEKAGIIYRARWQEDSLRSQLHKVNLENTRACKKIVEIDEKYQKRETYMRKRLIKEKEIAKEIQRLQITKLDELQNSLDKNLAQYEQSMQYLIQTTQQSHAEIKSLQNQLQKSTHKYHEVEQALLKLMQEQQEKNKQINMLRSQLRTCNLKYRQVTQQVGILKDEQKTLMVRCAIRLNRILKTKMSLSDIYASLNIQRMLHGLVGKKNIETDSSPDQVEIHSESAKLISDDLQVKNLTYKLPQDIRVACIVDDLTFHSYNPECNLYQLTPKKWRSELEEFKPELLFVESAWFGKDGLWQNTVMYCCKELRDITEWCKKHGIPTIFWNKEDPLRFANFMATAKCFDFIFTTDLDCVQKYKFELGHDRVFYLPFGCQPRLHNPIEKYNRKDAFCFAGGFYGRNVERTHDLENFTRELSSWRPLEIFKRNSVIEHPDYMWPETYHQYIVGSLHPTEIDKAYKGYRYAINLNSVKQSQTMFARRIYELLASNTLTVSNFSCGLRCVFGDLVITSDNAAEIRQRLHALHENKLEARVRLAGLRKVMRSHTYADYFNYILQKVADKPPVSTLPKFVVLTAVSSFAEVEDIAAHIERQKKVTLVLKLYLLNSSVSARKVHKFLSKKSFKYIILSEKTIDGKKLSELADNPSDWIVGMLAGDYYGANYLLDMALGTRYSTAQVIGKSSKHFYTTKKEIPIIELRDAEQSYCFVQKLAARCSMISASLAKAIDAKKWLTSLANWQYEFPEQLAIDPFNYCHTAPIEHWEKVSKEVDDLELYEGINFSELSHLSEVTQAKENIEVSNISLNGHQLVQLFLNNEFAPNSEHRYSDGEVKQLSNKMVRFTIDGTYLKVSSALPEDKFQYIYAKQEVSVQHLRNCLMLTDDAIIPLYLETGTGLNLLLTVLFLDAEGQRISHVFVSPNENHSLRLPAGTTYLRFGWRVYMKGDVDIKCLLFGKKITEPANILGQSNVLLLTSHYPSYDDLYRNGFVHSRVMAYRERGQQVDIFCLNKGRTIHWREFQDVDVISGSQSALHQMLASGRYRHVLVHFLYPNMWEVLKEFIDTIKVTVWIHGIEIQPWHRRKFNLESPEQQAKAKESSQARMDFWRGILQKAYTNLHLVFVSEYFANEVQEDLTIKLPADKFSIIHNPIDTELFNYIEKPVEQRNKILSIRPFASKKYANDISVRCIEYLARNKPALFREMQIKIIGDGALFDSILEPLRDFPNVQIERKFITQQEIAQLHKEYGLFLCPTRMDSQGVSRDEAMSSGLVPVTNVVAAIPEFTDSSCAVLSPSEDYIAMAEGIIELYYNPAKFSELSKAAAERVRQQSSKTLILERELSLFTS